MGRSILRPAMRDDAYDLSSRLRTEDVQEIYASSGNDPLEALLQGVELSKPHAWVLEAGGKPYAIGGIRDMGDGLGIVWLLCTPELDDHVFDFQRAAKRMLRWAFEAEGYRAIANVVSVENRKAIVWLKRLGFHFIERDIPIGRVSQLFHSFAIGRQDYV